MQAWMCSLSPLIAQGQRLIRHFVECSSHKHHAESHLYFSSEERNDSSPQSLLQVHFSEFGVQHKEIGFQWERSTKMHPKSHKWPSIHVRAQKTSVLLIQLCPRTRACLDGQRTRYPSQEAGLRPVGGCTPNHTTSWSCTYRAEKYRRRRACPAGASSLCSCSITSGLAM